MRAAFTIRDAVRKDLPAIVSIYNASIPSRMATGDMEPVTVASREKWLRLHNRKQHPLIVALDRKGTVIGWASLSPFFNGRASYRFSTEISVYIAPEYNRRGVASALTDELLARCPKLKLRTVTAFIFGHNAPSIAFFRKRGFKLWGRLPRIAEMDGREYDLDVYGLRL
jgi:phosphinothricin acetyltransferase